MVKNLKLRTKLFGGFTIVLILLLVIAIASFNALNETHRGMNRGEETNQIVLDINQARQQEKNYILRKDITSMGQVEAFIKAVEERALKAKTENERKTAQEEMEAVIQAANQYKQVFARFVQLESDKSKSRAEMEKRAAQALERVEGVRTDQDKELVAATEQAKTMVTERMGIFNDAGKIIKMVQDVQMKEQKFIAQRDPKERDRVVALVGKIKDLSGKLQERFKTEDEKLQAEQMMAAADGYAFGFEDYARSVEKQVAMEAQLEELAEKIKDAANEVILDQTAELVGLQNDPDINPIQWNKPYYNIDNAGKVIRWIQEAEAAQGRYRLTNEEDLKDDINSLVGRIVIASHEMRTGLTEQENKDLASVIFDSAQAFSAAFEEYDALIEKASGDGMMLQSYAVSLGATAATIQASQKNEVDLIQVQSQQLIQENLAKAEDANGIEYQLMTVRMSEKEYIITGGARAWLDKVGQQIAKLMEMIDVIKLRLKQENQLQQVEEAAQAIQSYKAAFNDYVNFMNLQAQAEEAMVVAARNAEEAAESSKTDQYSRIMKQMGGAKTTMWIVAPAAILLGLLLAFFITRGIGRNVAKAMRLADTVRRGDLTYRLSLNQDDEIGKLAASLDTMADGLESKAELANQIASGDLTADADLASENDSLGHALQIMTASLNEVLSEINKAVAQVTAGSAQVSDASQALSQGATEQAASLEEITSTMTELGSRTKTNAENAAQANQLSLTAREAAENGNTQMQEMVGAMDSISDSSKEIAKIIKAIDDIAFQTNLLALNAAVEAARAGKHGKGFAVVAQEVRNLAGRSAKAAQETSELIENSVKKVENGTAILDKTAVALAEIVDGTTKVADLVGEIAAASNEQAQGIAQVNQGLTQVEKVTQQNTANAEETASAAEQLSSQAAFLQQLLTRFKLKDQAYLPMDERPMQIEHDPGNDEGWGRRDAWEENDPKALPEGRRVEPKDMIALDDDEYGKY